MRRTWPHHAAQDPPASYRIRYGGGSDQRTSKPESPSGSSSTTSTAATSARLGPRRQNSTSSSTACGSPSNTASTAPSSVFQTQPATPAASARRRTLSRKKTPWTRPRTTTRLRVRRYSSSSYSEATPTPERPKTSDEVTGGDCTETQQRSAEFELAIE